MFSRGDYRIDEQASIVRKALTEDRTTSSLTRVIYAGEPVQIGTDSTTPAAGAPYMIPLTNGKPVIGTDYFAGVPVNDSDDTSAADGEITIALAIPSLTVMTAKGSTPANIDTQSELDAYLFDSVNANVAALVYTINEDEGVDDNVHGFVLIGGNYVTKEMDFTVKPLASLLGSNN